jgi:hypothetical protein
MGDENPYCRSERASASEESRFSAQIKRFFGTRLSRRHCGGGALGDAPQNDTSEKFKDSHSVPPLSLVIRQIETSILDRIALLDLPSCP